MRGVIYITPVTEKVKLLKWRNKMIGPIEPCQREYHESYSDYGVTKFIAKNGDGNRGVIIDFLNEEHTKAVLIGLTGEYYRKTIEVEEDSPDEWPKEIV